VQVSSGGAGPAGFGLPRWRRDGKVYDVSADGQQFLVNTDVKEVKISHRLFYLVSRRYASSGAAKALG
jgi:hypothetical protein